MIDVWSVCVCVSVMCELSDERILLVCILAQHKLCFNLAFSLANV